MTFFAKSWTKISRFEMFLERKMCLFNSDFILDNLTFLFERHKNKKIKLHRNYDWKFFLSTPPSCPLHLFFGAKEIKFFSVYLPFNLLFHSNAAGLYCLSQIYLPLSLSLFHKHTHSLSKFFLAYAYLLSPALQIFFP